MSYHGSLKFDPYITSLASETKPQMSLLSSILIFELLVLHNDIMSFLL